MCLGGNKPTNQCFQFSVSSLGKEQNLLTHAMQRFFLQCEQKPLYTRKPQLT